MSASTRDRYVTFAGLECDRHAAEIVALVHDHLNHAATDAV